MALLDAWRDRQVAMLARLVRAPSDNPPGDCAPHAEVVARELAALGLTPERHPVPGTLVRQRRMTRVTNLVVRHRFGPGPTLALNAHGDAVPPGEGWMVDPYGAAVQGGVMTGRGVAVSKSDIATYAFALAALKDSGACPRGSVELHVTYDEETGGDVGPRWLLSEGITRPDMAVCAGFSYGVVVAHNGCLHLEIELGGRSAHAARPESGVDALEAATAVLNELYDHRRRLRDRRSSIPGIGAANLVVGTIEAGSSTNVVPGRAVLRIDRRVIPEESLDEVEADLKQRIADVAAAFPGVRVTFRRLIGAEPLVPTDPSRRLADTVARMATQEFAEPIALTGVPLYTDARHYAAAGIPTVLYGAGPRTVEESGAHGPDERLLLSDLHRATRVIALAVLDVLGEARS